MPKKVRMSGIIEVHEINPNLFAEKFLARAVHAELWLPRAAL
jgi:hypothetical protein